MLRVLTFVAVVAIALISLPGCEDKAASGQKDFQQDIDKGKRPEPTAKKEPPGPGKGSSGFQQGELPPGGQQTPPPPPPKGGAKGGKGG